MPKKLNGLKPTPLRERIANPEPFVTPVDETPVQPDRIPSDGHAKQLRDQLQETAAQLHDVGNELLTTFDYLHNIIGGYEARIVAVERQQSDEPRQWPELMSRQTAAAYLDVSPSTLDRLVSEGHVTTTTPRGMAERYYRKADLDAFITEDATPW